MVEEECVNTAFLPVLAVVVVSLSGRLKQLYFWVQWFGCSAQLGVC